MNELSSQNSINPANLRMAIEEHFNNRSAQEIVARAEQLKPLDSQGRTASLAATAAEVSWLFMVCRDNTSYAKAMIFATRLLEELKDVNESVAGAMVAADVPDVPAVISLQHKRMLVSQPRTVAGILNGVVNSTKFQEMMLRLEKWATQPGHVPPKADLDDTSRIFASLAPILEESSL